MAKKTEYVNARKRAPSERNIQRSQHWITTSKNKNSVDIENKTSISIFCTHIECVADLYQSKVGLALQFLSSAFGCWIVVAVADHLKRIYYSDLKLLVFARVHSSLGYLDLIYSTYALQYTYVCLYATWWNVSTLDRNILTNSFLSHPLAFIHINVPWHRVRPISIDNPLFPQLILAFYL